MAHEIENGRMMFVGTTPWHGIGKALQAAPTVEEGIRLAGLDWKIRLEQLRTDDGKVSDHKATVRDEDNSILGVVGPRYQPLQNIEAFKWFQPFLDAGAAELHTAGCLQHGKKVWVLARIGGNPLEITAGDTVERFVLLSNSHDGTKAIRVGFTPIRVVCANTLAMAHGDDASKIIRIRHTSSMHDNLQAVRDVMNLANSEFEATAEQYRKLAHKHINPNDVQKYVKKVLGVEEVEDKDLSAIKYNQIREITNLSWIGRGNNLVGTQNTLWACYNGFTEWLGTHGKNADSRLASLWFGTGAETNKRALEIALQMAV